MKLTKKPKIKKKTKAKSKNKPIARTSFADIYVSDRDWSVSQYMFDRHIK